MSEPAPAYGPADTPWVQTYTGVRWDILHPRADDVRCEDIGHALAHLCRFAGHTREHYSVAQHAVLVSEFLERAYVPLQEQLAGLLHDAAEAYLGDLPTPVKRLFPAYADLEAVTLEVIFKRFGLPPRLSPAVRYADEMVLAAEARALLADVSGWALPPEPKTLASRVPVTPWPIERARRRFLDRLDHLVVATA